MRIDLHPGLFLLSPLRLTLTAERFQERDWTKLNRNRTTPYVVIFLHRGCFVYYPYLMEWCINDRWSLVESWIGEVDVFLVHALFGQGNGLTEVINLSKAIESVVPQRIYGLFERNRPCTAFPPDSWQAGGIPRR